MGIQEAFELPPRLLHLRRFLLPRDRCRPPLPGDQWGRGWRWWMWGSGLALGLGLGLGEGGWLALRGLLGFWLRLLGRSCTPLRLQDLRNQLLGHCILEQTSVLAAF